MAKRDKAAKTRKNGFRLETEEPVAPTVQNSKPIRPLTDGQSRYFGAIKGHTLTFCIGPAGTGKTFICAALAADALNGKKTERIIITRPAIEAGRGIGFLPGELEEKFDPYFEPFRDVLIERLGKGRVEYEIKAGRIQAKPLEFLRGKTFKDCWVVLDEAQNTTPVQMKLFLTRIGESCKVIVNGDVRQKDIRGTSGLEDAWCRLQAVPDVGFVEFTRADIVRSGLVQRIVEAFESDDAAQDAAEHSVRNQLPGFITDR
jgi:phosphate starvation-inducible PhoH-like protein